jgi:hypothetical protein
MAQSGRHTFFEGPVLAARGDGAAKAYRRELPV